MQMEVRRCLSFSLGSTNSLGALKRSHQLNRAFIIETTRKPGWHLEFSRSKCLSFILWKCLTSCRWVKMFDLKMHQENRNVCLTLDNFSGHNIAYWPTNVKIEFFKPDLTPFVQPLDAGVIRCFKAHYCQAFCQRTSYLDDAGDWDIYKITLIEAMFMAKEAWDAINSETIKNCWKHTGIQWPPIMLRIPPLPQKDPNSHTTAAAWDILEKFATTDMSLPQAESALKDHFGDQYINEKWQPALDAVMAVENDATAALESIKELWRTSNPAASASILPLHTLTTQCANLEANLMKSVKTLKSWNRIFGPLPTIAELISPPKEWLGENEDSLLQELNDDKIVAQVHYKKALEQGEIVEIESEDEEDEDTPPQVTTTNTLEMCRILSTICLNTGASSALELSRVLHCFWAEVSQEYMQNMKQPTLVDLWGSK